MKKVSAGVVMYRRKNAEPEILLVHPGGPFWQKKDFGAWDFPKGEPNDGDDEADLLPVAKREFEEETGFKPEGEFHYLASVIRPRDGKRVEFWIVEGDLDETKIRSNTCFIDWPPKSGKKLEIPEVDKAGWFTLEVAKKKIFPYHLATLGATEAFLKEK